MNTSMISCVFYGYSPHLRPAEFMTPPLECGHLVDDSFILFAIRRPFMGTIWQYRLLACLFFISIGTRPDNFGNRYAEAVYRVL